MRGNTELVLSRLVGIPVSNQLILPQTDNQAKDKEARLSADSKQPTGPSEAKEGQEGPDDGGWDGLSLEKAPDREAAEEVAAIEQRLELLRLEHVAKQTVEDGKDGRVSPQVEPKLPRLTSG